MNLLRRAWALLKDAGQGMVTDQTTMMGAALAYYTVFSIAPLLVIAIGVAGAFMGRGAGQEIFQTIRSFVGPNGASAIESIVRASAQRPNAGIFATIVGIATMIVGASYVFQQLQTSLNIIWRVAIKPSAGWWLTIRQRLFSFAMVAVLGFVLLVSLLISAGLSAFGNWAAGALPGGQMVWVAANFLVSLAVIVFLFGSIMKLLPDVLLPWRAVLPGAIVAALLFDVGKAGIGAYIAKSGVASSYGAAGSLIVVLLWVYYSSQILFFGAELTRAWAAQTRANVVPREGSMFAMTPFHTAAIAKRTVETDPRLKDEIPAADLFAAECSAALAALLLVRGLKRPSRALAGGVAAGISLGILFALEKAGRLHDKAVPGNGEKALSLGRRLLKEIPPRVKLATVIGGVGGALRSGGREAGREIKQKVKESIGTNPK